MIAAILKYIFIFVLSLLSFSKAFAIQWLDYDHIDPKHLIPTQALKQALEYFDEIKDKIRNPNFLTIIDFTKKSNQQRFYLVQLTTGVVKEYKVAHGIGSDSNNDGIAEKFSNHERSKASSIGFYLTKNTYIGKHGTSLILKGLSETNSNAESRAIVIHGSKYVSEKHHSISGRSWGCPALDHKISNSIIQKIKEESLVYAWAGQKTKIIYDFN